MQPKLTFTEVLARLENLLQENDGRVIVGIVGKPGAGKSALSKYLMKKLPPEVTALVPMDGFHLSNLELKNAAKSDRKGAPDTFDVNGYINLLENISSQPDHDIYFPIFHRELEESIAAEGKVTPQTRLILTEGNYLLSKEYGWQGVAKYLSESYFVELDESIRLSRLVARHKKYGKSSEAAHAWAHGSDESNAKFIEKTKASATYLVLAD